MKKVTVQGSFRIRVNFQRDYFMPDYEADDFPSNDYEAAVDTIEVEAACEQALAERNFDIDPNEIEVDKITVTDHEGGAS